MKTKKIYKAYFTHNNKKKRIKWSGTLNQKNFMKLIKGVYQPEAKENNKEIIMVSRDNQHYTIGDFLEKKPYENMEHFLITTINDKNTNSITNKEKEKLLVVKNDGHLSDQKISQNVEKINTNFLSSPPIRKISAMDPYFVQNSSIMTFEQQDSKELNTPKTLGFSKFNTSGKKDEDNNDNLILEAKSEIENFQPLLFYEFTIENSEKILSGIPSEKAILFGIKNVFSIDQNMYMLRDIDSRRVRLLFKNISKNEDEFVSFFYNSSIFFKIKLNSPNLYKATKNFLNYSIANIEDCEYLLKCNAFKSQNPVILLHQIKKVIFDLNHQQNNLEEIDIIKINKLNNFRPDLVIGIYQSLQEKETNSQEFM